MDNTTTLDPLITNYILIYTSFNTLKITQMIFENLLINY